MSVKRVAIVNAVASNTGDAAILFSLVARLQDAFGDDVETVIYDSQPATVQRLYPELHVRQSGHLPLERLRGTSRFPRPMRALHRRRLLSGAWLLKRRRLRAARLVLRRGEFSRLQEVAEFDLVVGNGGTYLVEVYPMWTRVLDLRIAVELGRPVALFTQSLGPFLDSENRREVRKLVADASLVLLRDVRSRRHLEDIGASVDRAVVSADAAFASADPELVDRVARHPPKRIAVSVRNWALSASGAAGMEGYIASIAAAVEALVNERGATVEFLSTCQGLPEYWTDDSQCARAVLETLDPAVLDRVTIDDAFHTPADLQAKLATFDLLIATRMHAAILGLNAGLPVLPIAYEFKTRELFESLDLKPWVTDFEAIDPVAFTQLVLSFVDQTAAVKGTMRDHLLAQRAAALDGGRLLNEAVGSAPGDR